MIDLHLHTTASDGCLSPSALVAHAAAAGITVMAVTDHDTLAGLGEARTAALAGDIELITGIEVTAVHDGRDVHMLGYFIDQDDEDFNAFLVQQRERRAARVREIGARLSRLGITIDIDRLLATAHHTPDASIGRPMIARALIAAGQVSSTTEAFERYLGTGRPAFVPRVAETPAAVVHWIHRARGIASMAHPGVTNRPDVMAALVDAGLDAIEVYHSDHSPETVRALREFADDRRLLVTGGSDFHGDDDTRERPVGRTHLPADDFARLRAAVGG